MDDEPSTSAISSISSTTDDDGNRPSFLSLDSPLASTFLRTAQTLEGLSRQMESLKDGGEEIGEQRCTCGAMMSEREKMENRLKLAGEIGDAFLQRCEALEKKYQREVERYEHQLEVKRTALAESIRRVNNLEKANTTHLQKYAEMSRKNEAIEKRYTQALQTQTLTQQSLTHVRSELTTLRKTTNRQSVALASGAGVEERLLEVERRYDEAKEIGEAETRRARDEGRRRKRADARIAELEEQLAMRSREIDEIKQARARDSQDSLANAKDRLAMLHSELSETFRSDSPADLPEYQRTLEDLVATNALLKHDASELGQMLTDSRSEVRNLRKEVDELRAAIGVAGRLSPEVTIQQHVAIELSHSHSRTESSPLVGSFTERTGGAKMSVAHPNRAGNISPWEHHRRTSMARSMASTSTADGLTSPGLGMGPIGEFGGALLNDEVIALSPPPLDGRESPKPIFRTSPSGGIAYVLHGVPKSRASLPRPPARRSVSVDRPRPGARSFSGVAPIAEVAPGDDEQSANPDIGTEEPVSPGGSEYFHAAEASRKRRSILSSRGEASSPNNSINFSPSASNTLVEHSISDDFPSPMSESALMTAADHKRVHRRTLLLLTRSAGVQTEPLRPSESGEHQMKPTLESAPTVMSKGTSPVLPADTSETSSLHENRNSVLLALIEQMSKVVGKVRSADIPTLNKRLKKQHLPGDVGYLSRSTLRNLQLEISDLRNHFRGGTDLGVLGRREFTLLLKLFKDVFSDLIDLQAIVNDVTVEPSLAKKLQKDAYRDEEEGDIKASKQASGLGWIAAPITKFFVTPAGEAADISAHHASPRPGRGQEKSRLQPIPVKAAPKQQASTSATATHISVEFGGSGMIRRATPMAPPAVQSVIDGLPPSPNSVVEELQGQQMSRTMSGSTASEKLAPPTVRAPGTLRPSRSRANRNELLGIFVGAARPVTHTRGGPWQILDNGEPPYTGGARTVRAVSSQSFGDKTVRQRDATNQCKPLSSNVNAVIDSAAEQLDTDDSATFHPAMLERTLRPEGLSDSSIRWTFVSDADQGEGFLATSALNPGPQPRTAAYGTPSGTEKRGGVFERITNRFYPFRGSAAEISWINPDAATIDPPPVAGHGVGPVAASSARIVTSTASVVSGSVTNSATAISSSQTGIFGLLASSLAGATEIRSTSQHLADEEEDEMVGASLRHPVHVPRSVRTSSGKGVWQ